MSITSKSILKKFWSFINNFFLGKTIEKPMKNMLFIGFFRTIQEVFHFSLIHFPTILFPDQLLGLLL